ncbi:anti-sigma factor [Bradyrhizobium sp. U87765 SZCCT0131]|uniref:anti-sigma factor n=1 Tax=unclassified Bradyrhizobium TaxID=2631580 RepID=UPI001BA64763|nr:MULTISPECIES: anti-sigma factor [unclassified Bradyrhizobium]MBR1222457.1 anti-sigma factor [Bradyrhizobium sp. U87765 SZCCT0131]MBR1264059.1 anti-sigma factor [Bradyrhizobium sp. U87765 SZCCT0134]MBR1308158.1 anti-sigma factor [Bradyrhizobium sp. U87765 SZCCT0110]MBR1320309.1 anti-sigma factor [Bradyrhizobium sp. U87765 SZCCT0109]MBR1348578.1 anti-sigma factor [Bradyrhizobium sp. U87765 SZCCT0048]
MSYSEDHIVLAAEYVLGTLDIDERAQVETMMTVDGEYRRVVESWQNRLGELNAMVGAVEPSPELWGRIRAAIGLTSQQLPMALPELPPPPAPEPVAPAVDVTVERAQVIAFESRVRRWRNVTAVATALAASLAAVVVTQVVRPDLLPAALRGKPRIETVQVQVPVQVAAPVPAQFVAVLQKGTDAPAFILTVDLAGKTFTVRRVGAEAEQGKSYELWLVSDKFPRPRSLGVIGDSDFTARPALAAYDAATINDATYAVTVEPEGGSPTGVATGPIVFTGKLVETVPAASPAPSTPPR